VSFMIQKQPTLRSTLKEIYQYVPQSTWSSAYGWELKKAWLIAKKTGQKMESV